ncbi:MAG TPA: hypothetical protein VFW92_09320 [Candidatus Limnocylindrales bacterium]|nr:hypothetical protein [Candidatus Limnocylindrales bacterium]
MYFYEIHEGDTDLFTDALLAHELEFDEEEFLRLVLEARERVLDAFEEDTLVEAVANELQRGHGFIHVDDARLTAAVNVAEREGETFLAEIGAEPATALGDEDEDDEEDEDDLDFEGPGLRSLRVTLDRNRDLTGDEDEDGARPD